MPLRMSNRDSILLMMYEKRMRSLNPIMDIGDIMRHSLISNEIVDWLKSFTSLVENGLIHQGKHGPTFFLTSEGMGEAKRVWDWAG